MDTKYGIIETLVAYRRFEESQKILQRTSRCLKRDIVTVRLLLDVLDDKIHLFFDYCDVKRVIRGSP